jgi:ABC-2 type transport system permease protein
MADLSAQRSAEFVPAGDGPFSRLARTQYAALAAMRAQRFANAFRTAEGAFEFGARTVSLLVYTMMGLGLGVGAGSAAYTLVSEHRLKALSIEFWLVFVLWQAVSIVLASFLEQFDLGSMLRFPVGFASFFVLHLVFGLVDAATLAGGLSCLGLVIGVIVARPDLSGAAVVALLGFALFNLLLVRAILAWIDRWLAQRRSREIVSAIFLIALVGLQLLNPALHDDNWPGHEHRSSTPPSEQRWMIQGEAWLKAAASVQAWLPPGLSGAVLLSVDKHDTRAMAEETSALGFFILVAAGLLAIRLRAEYRGESLGEAPSRLENEKQENVWFLSGSGPISAVIEKELRTMFRSMPQLYAIFVPMIMVVIIASLFRNGIALSHRALHMALPVCVAYGLLGFTQLIYNNLGAEGKGIQMIFLFPVPVRRVLLAKNVFHGSLYALVALASGTLASLRIGRPDPVIVAVTFAWLAFALPANLAAGNLFSLTMAYRVNLGRIGRQSGSQANALLSMLVQTTILGVGASIFSLCSALGRLWWSVPILLACSAIAVIAWLLVLRFADTLAIRRRDALIDKLAREA